MTDVSGEEVSRRAFVTVAAGVSVAGLAGPTAGQAENDTAADNGTPDRNATVTNETQPSGNETGGDDGAVGGETYTIEMNDDNVFSPDEMTVAPGDTVVWENVGTADHTVTAYGDDIPEEATYFASGGFDAEEAARRSYARGNPDAGAIPGGESYERTFEVEGTYEYFCVPHEGLGMTGVVEVRPDAGGAGGSEGGGEPSVPDAAKSLGIAATMAFSATLALAFGFITYGGDYGRDEDE